MTEIALHHADYGLFDGDLKMHTSLSWPLTDQGLLRGEGFFETMWLREGQIVALSHHLARLEKSVLALGLLTAEQAHYRMERLKAGLGCLLEANGEWLRSQGEASCRITLTQAHDSAVLSPLSTHQRQRRLGVHLKTLVDVRGDGALTRHKSLSWGVSALTLRQLKSHQEGVWQSPQGELLEGLTSNLFVRVKSTLFTPPLSAPILPGTARGRVLRHARTLGLDCQERAVSKELLGEADEVFMTSALLPIAPALSLDGRPLGHSADTCLTQLKALLEKD